MTNSGYSALIASLYAAIVVMFTVYGVYYRSYTALALLFGMFIGFVACGGLCIIMYLEYTDNNDRIQ